MMRLGAVAGAVAVIGVVLPATPAPAVVIPTGWARISVDDGCLARVVRGDYKLTVPSGGRMELPVGKYKLKVRPSSCDGSKKTFRIREGKTIRAKVSLVQQPVQTPQPQ